MTIHSWKHKEPADVLSASFWQVENYHIENLY